MRQHAFYALSKMRSPFVSYALAHSQVYRIACVNALACKLLDLLYESEVVPNKDQLLDMVNPLKPADERKALISDASHFFSSWLENESGIPFPLRITIGYSSLDAATNFVQYSNRYTRSLCDNTDTRLNQILIFDDSVSEVIVHGETITHLVDIGNIPALLRFVNDHMFKHSAFRVSVDGQLLTDADLDDMDIVPEVCHDAFARNYQCLVLHYSFLCSLSAGSQCGRTACSRAGRRGKVYIIIIMLNRWPTPTHSCLSVYAA